MPTYVYRREDGSTFEVVQRISDDPLMVDPETGQKVQRVITGAGLIFKGEGFYLTDYVRKNGNGSKTEKESSTDAKTSESKTTEASPAKSEKAAPSTP